jgi:hypothetical protein
MFLQRPVHFPSVIIIKTPGFLDFMTLIIFGEVMNVVELFMQFCFLFLLSFFPFCPNVYPNILFFFLNSAICILRIEGGRDQDVISLKITEFYSIVVTSLRSWQEEILAASYFFPRKFLMNVNFLLCVVSRIQDWLQRKWYRFCKCSLKLFDIWCC